ncbi:MAG: phosphoenolpyruvate synthase [Candidatus Cloacimonadota bacterium]|nr:MAG: phosphoenolpyruvate synthase [Candidatus Cloacimonadota bacterium]PIE78328.1 MAG: phosphoenolpyruvate synthase [Candidatus Delongbacteria bacterium]
MYNKSFSTAKYSFKDTPYHALMNKRVTGVLLICSKYDKFLLEEDGRIDAKLFEEYVSLNLRYPPSIKQVSNAEEAFKALEKSQFDLVISMLNVGNIQAFEMAKQIKNLYPKKPVVVLTPFSKEISKRLVNEDFSYTDYIFSWLGNPNLFLAIIKLIEDKMNVHNDVERVGVPVILMVEDSIRYISSYLPMLYRLLFIQAIALMNEGLNDHQQMMKMRGRPKIILATTYEEAVEKYQKYKHNILGVISDVRYPKDGNSRNESGIELTNLIKSDRLNIPIILQSSEEKYEDVAMELGVGFINKFSKNLTQELQNIIKEQFWFGDFIFRLPENESDMDKMPGKLKEFDRASDLRTLRKKLKDVPEVSLKYHFQNHHFSKWLKARALYSLEKIVRERSLSDFDNVSSTKEYMNDTIKNYRIYKSRGKIARFDKDKYDESTIFSRIGNGLLGGKGRGLAFLDSILMQNSFRFKYDDVEVSIPRTVVLTTDIFEEFMDINNLYSCALSDVSDEDILMRFISSELPERVKYELRTFLDVVKSPVAVRSSSLLEDTQYQPFAGIYSTYMIPNNHNDIAIRINQLGTAIKSVFASVFFKNSKSYMTATKNMIDEEKMSVILQEVTGKNYGDSFYPTISGVARSVNFYPMGKERQEHGVVNIAVGLGKTIVDGGVSLRFSPVYPKQSLQLTNPDMAIRNTQKEFYALDLDTYKFTPSIDEGVNLKTISLDDADRITKLYTASTYDYAEHVIRDGFNYKGKKIATFSSILKYGYFPLARIIKDLMELGEKEMNNPVEIEFAANLDTESGAKIFNVLQIRPIVAETSIMDINIEEIKADDTVVISEKALGNGIYKGLKDFIYIKPEAFNPANSKEMKNAINKINSKMDKEDRSYVLCGPGRWGSSDPWLGIPVSWPEISRAKIIIESGLKSYQIEASQGSHFFQNITSLGVAYFTVNPFNKDGYYDIDFLNGFEPYYEDEFYRHVRFDEDIITHIDGKKGIGVIYKPVKNKEEDS